MLHSAHQRIAPQSECRTKLASILVVVAVIAGITAFVGALSYLYSVNTEERESAQLLQNYNDKADVLVWALEGSARTMMGSRHGASPLFISSDLLEEIANQPGIMSLCLVNSEGEILAHSDPSNTQGHTLIGERKPLPDPINLAQLVKNESIGSFTQLPAGKAYEVIKRFTPNDPHMRRHQNRMHQGRMNQGHMMQDLRNRMDALGPLYMIVAFDAKPYDDHLLEVQRNNRVMSLLVTAVACCLAILFLVLYSFVRSHRLLKNARALASQIVTNLPIGLITTDTNGNITLFNSQSLHLLSINADSVPTSISQLPHLNWREIMQRLDSTQNSLFEDEIEIPLGETGSRAISLSAAKVLDSDGSDSGYLCILRDLQTVKTLQKQIRLNERLSALGNMAAGVAHEIRNPLSTLKGYATYLSEKLKDDAKAYATGQCMIEEVDRLNRVVTDLLYLAKPEQLALVDVNLTQVAQKALQLASFDASAHNIEIALTIGESPLIIQGDSDKLIQALLNILLNSIQSISHDKGAISISVLPEHPTKTWANRPENSLSRPQSDDSNEPATSSLLKGSDRTKDSDGPNALGEPNSSGGLDKVDRQDHAYNSGALIRIRDNGSGMTEETLANLFTPYFSTKASGSGLGMTITHQIIESHRGSVSVSSVFGEGTVFTIRLPLGKAPSMPSTRPSGDAGLHTPQITTSSSSENIPSSGSIGLHIEKQMEENKEDSTTYLVESKPTLSGNNHD